MTGIFPLLCFVVMVAAVVKSRRTARTVAYGVLACALTFAVYYALTEGLQLNVVIMANAFVPAMFVISAYTMWTHSRTTMKKTHDKAEVAAAETNTDAPPSSSMPSAQG